MGCYLADVETVKEFYLCGVGVRLQFLAKMLQYITYKTSQRLIRRIGEFGDNWTWTTGPVMRQRHQGTPRRRRGRAQHFASSRHPALRATSSCGHTQLRIARTNERNEPSSRLNSLSSTSDIIRHIGRQCGIQHTWVAARKMLPQPCRGVDSLF